MPCTTILRIWTPFLLCSLDHIVNSHRSKNLSTMTLSEDFLRPTVPGLLEWSRFARNYVPTSCQQSWQFKKSPENCEKNT